jgi:hypothetical protein
MCKPAPHSSSGCKASCKSGPERSLSVAPTLSIFSMIERLAWSASETPRRRLIDPDAANAFCWEMGSCAERGPLLSPTPIRPVTLVGLEAAVEPGKRP